MFVHLHCHSHYSFLRGVASPDEIIAAAKEQSMPAVALTDTNGMHAAVSFYQKAKDAGIKPIVGVTLDVAIAGAEREIPRLRADKNDRPSARNDSLAMVLLAMDMEGYSNLCQLTMLRHLGTTKLSSLPVPASPTGRRQADPGTIEQSAAAETDGRPVTLQELAEYNRGVIALCPLPARLPDTSTRRGTIHR